VGNFEGNKFLKFLFKNFEKIFKNPSVQLVLNTSIVPHKIYFENLEFYFRKYIEILKFSKIFSSKITCYRIGTNIGKELNLTNWRITMQSPSLNIANIFSMAYQL